MAIEILSVALLNDLRMFSHVCAEQGQSLPEVQSIESVLPSLLISLFSALFSFLAEIFTSLAKHLRSFPV